MMIFIWIFVFVVIMVVMNEVTSSTDGWSFRKRGKTYKRPLDLLKERYARGEIEKEEFEERKHILKNSG